MKVLLIDDVRLPSYIASTYGIDVTDVAKNYEQGIEKLKEGGWDLLCLDHDLGGIDSETGYDVMCFLEENQQYLPKDILFVTANPVGRKNMLMVYRKLYE